MKLTKALVIGLVAAGSAAMVQAEDLKITKLSKPAKLTKVKAGIMRSAPYKLSSFPKDLAGKPCVILPRGSGGKPGLKFSFTVNKPVTVYLFVHKRGKYAPEGWKNTKMKGIWLVKKSKYHDAIFTKDFPAGKVDIPEHKGIISPKTKIYGVPHMAVIKTK